MRRYRRILSINLTIGGLTYRFKISKYRRPNIDTLKYRYHIEHFYEGITQVDASHTGIELRLNVLLLFAHLSIARKTFQYCDLVFDRVCFTCRRHHSIEFLV